MDRRAPVVGAAGARRHLRGESRAPDGARRRRRDGRRRGRRRRRARGDVSRRAPEPRAPLSSDGPSVSFSIRSFAPPTPNEAPSYLATHGRSFWFATALVPEPHRSRIVGVYAFCRYTDDLVDRASGSDPAALHAKLDRWLEQARVAYEGRHTSVPLLNNVMRDMAESRVPFAYVRQLIEGMRMDIDGRRYESLAELRWYCHHVASVVGLWLTELFGVHDAWVLERAARLGTAMQLTNIIRDVGEDRRLGRLYLPADWMAVHGVTESMLDDLRQSDAPIP